MHGKNIPLYDKIYLCQEMQLEQYIYMQTNVYNDFRN